MNRKKYAMNGNIKQVLWSIVGGGIVAGGIAIFQNNATKEIIIKQKDYPVMQTSIQSKPYASLDFTKAATASIDAVVHVKVEAIEQKKYYDPFRDFFYGDGDIVKEYRSQGAGSGVIISSDGYIVSNYHVVKGADEISVTLNNKENYTATLVGKDPSTDLALLKIEGQDFQYLELANSDSVMVGEWVLAVGNPFNLTSTVTAGIISAKARNINILHHDPSSKNFPVESFIQTDAAVNPGNSGGALINTEGKLVGINTAIASTTGAYAGYAFAIPSNLVKKTAQDLKKYGTVQRAVLGVRINDINDELKTALDLKNKDGVYIASIVSGSSADKGALKAQDVIIGINGEVVKSSNELQAKIALFSPGDEIRVQIIRSGQSLDKKVTLQNSEGSLDKISSSTDVSLSLGATLKPIDASLKQKLGLSHGVLVSKLESGKLRDAGIKEGFVITKINDINIKDVEQIESLLSHKKGGILLEGYYKKGVVNYYALAI